jgi:hypothetical protein
MFEPRAWQVYTYIVMRIGPSGIGWLTFDEMAWDLGFKSIPKLKPYVAKLVEDGWLLQNTSRSREYFLVRDPVQRARELYAKGELPPDRVEGIDEILQSLKWPTLHESVDVPPIAAAQSEPSASSPREAFERVRNRATHAEVVIVGGVTEYTGNSRRPAFFNGQVQLGRYDDETFEVRVPIGTGGIPTLTVPYALLRQAFVDVSGRLHVLLKAGVMWNGRELSFYNPTP